MLRRFKRALASRPARKFRKSPLAVAALAVILVYAAIGLWVMAMDGAHALGKRTGWFDLERAPLLHMLTVEKTMSVVGPGEQPGFGSRPKAEGRLKAVTNTLREIDQAMRLRARGDETREQRIEAALANITMGDRRLVQRPLEEFRTEIDAIRGLKAELDAIPDLNKAPEARPKVDEIERRTQALFAEPPGSAKTVDTIAMSLGTDLQGRSIMLKAIYSIKVAVQIGLVVAIVSTLLGALLGSAAAYFGGWVDQAVVWLYSTLSSLPDLVLLGVLVFMFTGSIFDDVTKPYLSLVPLYVAMCLTFWIGPCRVIRGEVLKIKELEYVQAATAIGFSRVYILLKHALPNTLHLMFINFSLLFVAAIKNEVVLSFLGLGVKAGTSWGMMIQESIQQVIKGFYWQIGAATVFMFVLVLAFNILSDALQDAFDPKHVG